MFIKTRVRGIPLYALAMSRLCPQINLLAQLWEEDGRGGRPKGNCSNPIKQAKPKTWLMLLAGLLLALGSYLFFFGGIESSRCGAWIFGLGLFCFVAYIMAQPWDFAKAIRRLDECLKQQEPNGIATIPPYWSELEAYLRQCMDKGAYLVVYAEDKFGRNSELADQWNLHVRTLSAIAKEFGFDLGKHYPYYKKAAVRLARDKQEKEKLSFKPAPAGA